MHTQNCWETVVCHLRSVTAAEASLHIPADNVVMNWL